MSALFIVQHRPTGALTFASADFRAAYGALLEAGWQASAGQGCDFTIPSWFEPCSLLHADGSHAITYELAVVPTPDAHDDSSRQMELLKACTPQAMRQLFAFRRDHALSPLYLPSMNRFGVRVLRACADPFIWADITLPPPGLSQDWWGLVSGWVDAGGGLREFSHGDHPTREQAAHLGGLILNGLVEQANVRAA